MQYGKTGVKAEDAEWAKLYNDEDREDAKIGYSRPVRFRVWYDVASKDIKAAAYLYQPLSLKAGYVRNKGFKKELKIKVIELPKQVLYGKWVFGGKKTGGFNMTNKWFFIGLKVTTALKKLKYGNGKISPESYWLAFTEPMGDGRGHSLDSLYMKRYLNVRKTGQAKKFGPRGAICQCPDRQRYFVGELKKYRVSKHLKDVKYGCNGGKVVKRFAKKEDCKQCNGVSIECDKRLGWWTKRMSDYPSTSNSENAKKFRFGYGRNLKYYYTIGGDSLKSWEFWHMDKTKNDKTGQSVKFKGSFLGHIWGASGSSHFIERYNHFNKLIHFRPNAINSNDKNGNIIQSNWFTNAKVNIHRIHKNPMYDSVENPNLHPGSRVNGFFIDSNQNPSDVTGGHRTIYGELFFKIPNFFNKGENFRNSEFNAMLSHAYRPYSKEGWLNNSNWSNHLDLRRQIRVYRMQLNKDTPL